MSKYLGGVLLLICLFAYSYLQAQTRPNILLIYVDDLGYGDLGSFGHPVIQTPNLDRLAREGMTLTNYYAPSALCSPSRAGLLTGRIPYRTGIKSWIPEGTDIYLHDEEITLAEVLKSAGYATAIVGKWHLNSDLGSEDEPQPTDQGFDYFYGHNAFQIPTNHNPINIYRNGELLEAQEGYTADLYADEAIAWLKKQDSAVPFFLYLSMAEPHTTFENPPAYNQMYADYTDGEIVPIPSGLDRIPTETLVPRGPGEYYANITYMDAQLGRVLAELEQSGAKENTIVVFTSDNGPVTSQWLQWFEVNAHGSTGGYRGRKHFLYEGGIKVPAIISYPGVIEPGSSNDQLLVAMDFFVTLAELGQATVPDDRPIDGISIEPLFDGGKLPARQMFWALASMSELEYVIREGAWKLMLDSNQEPKELYNLSNDPLEFFNLIADENKTTQHLLTIYNEYIASIENDPLRPR
jgi:arylsulfatase A-like enzyme